MEKGKASNSAAIAALFRALESIKPENKRVVYDPYAIQFLSGVQKVIFNTRFLISGRLLDKVIHGFISRFAPGAINYVIVRTRYIDDYLNQCLEGGFEQLVHLGAGYDSRAFRFTALKDRVTVFEVDHPDNQRTKKEKVRDIFGYLPNHVTYVPVDFEKERLYERLSSCGYNKKLKTLFIWEGVTVYITADAVDDTLAFVVHNSGEGSAIVFDYAYKSVIDGRIKDSEKMRGQIAKAGEPFKFGIEEGTLEGFLDKRGFGAVKDVNASFLEKNYLKNTNRKVYPYYGIVHATIKPRH